MELILNGKTADISDFEADELAQAVLISLFSWRKSAADDGPVAPYRQGWWGDTFAQETGERIGSRLWLLQRQKMLPQMLRRAEAYAKEALKWLTEDAVVARIEVTAERSDIDQLTLTVVCFNPDDTQALAARFPNGLC